RAAPWARRLGPGRPGQHEWHTGCRCTPRARAAGRRRDDLARRVRVRLPSKRITRGLTISELAGEGLVLALRIAFVLLLYLFLYSLVRAVRQDLAVRGAAAAPASGRAARR